MRMLGCPLSSIQSVLCVKCSGQIVELMLQFDYSENHVHCLAHVINLAAQAVMRSLKATTDQTEDQIATDDDDDVGEIVPKV